MSGLDDFLGEGAAAVAPSEPERVNDPPEVPTGDDPAMPEVSVSTETASGGDSPGEEGKDGEEPWGVVQIKLPSDIHVYYQAGPKRLYKLQHLFPEDEADAAFHDWTEVPSMSTITKILDKPGLVNWGEKVGINLVQQLVKKGYVDLDFVKESHRPEERHPPFWEGVHLQEIGKTKKLTNYYVKDAASTRGQSVHDALEAWAMTGNLPDPEVFAPNEQGYIRGLVKFLEESGYEAMKSEVMVASVKHRVAGRFDLTGRLPKDVSLVYHLTEKNEKRKTFPAGSSIVDLKTSTGVFEEYHFQVAGYKGCMVESGYEEPERGYILRVTRDGRYELVDLAADWLDFWALKLLYDCMAGVKERAHQNHRKDWNQTKEES